MTDRFETGAREAASFSVSYSRSAAATQISYQVAVVAMILVGVPVAWWLETPPAILAFGLLAFVRIIPRAGGIQTGYQGLVNAVAPLQAIRRLTEKLERDAVSHSSAKPVIDWEQIELSDVGVEDTLQGSQRNWILRDVSLELKHGDVYII